ATDLCQRLHPRHVIGSSVCLGGAGGAEALAMDWPWFVNLASFYAECQRDMERAAEAAR
ncbi:unnamed protein product, partial [Effrenium voratum]